MQALHYSRSHQLERSGIGAPTAACDMLRKVTCPILSGKCAHRMGVHSEADRLQQAIDRVEQAVPA